MKKYYFPSEVREADERAVVEQGIPSCELMENAGIHAAEVILDKYKDTEKFLILCGHGNNGGDGFVTARRLIEAGRSAVVLASAEPSRYKGDALLNLQNLSGLSYGKYKFFYSAECTDNDILKFVGECGCIVDALLGTGSMGAPRGEAARLLALCVKPGCVVSLDIPSGIDSLNGAVYEPCADAAECITFLKPKSGMALHPAKERCGHVTVVSIGVDPGKVLRDTEALCSYDRKDISSLLPVLGRDIHKGSRGGVFIFGGSDSYRGAPILAAYGALRAGAGLVVLAIPDFLTGAASAALPEAVFLPLETKDKKIDCNSFKTLADPWLKRCGSLVFGPGMGRERSLLELTEFVWNELDIPLLFDADALWFLSKFEGKVKYREDSVITPHAGEAAQLLHKDLSEVTKDRIGSCRALSKLSGIALLKGQDTLIAHKGLLRHIAEGSPSLAVPGSGDVLSGAVGAFMAGGLDTADAATLGALVHAVAGVELEKTMGTRGVLAREIANEITYVLRQWGEV